MIARLKGLVDGQDEGSALIDVQGVVYRVLCSGKTLAGLPVKGQPVTLEIEYIVSQDVPALIGFGSLDELDAYRLLVTVQGVGPKAALAVLSTHAPQNLFAAIANSDAKAIQAAKGVGAKAAARIITDLKDKVGAFAGVVSSSGGPALAAPASGTAASDAVSALVNLGYGQPDATKAVAAAMTDEPEADVSALIRMALQRLSG